MLYGAAKGGRTVDDPVIDKDELFRDIILWAELSESYDDNAISDYHQHIYEHVFNNYPAA